jgi:hypothetical protein
LKYGLNDYWDKEGVDNMHSSERLWSYLAALLVSGLFVLAYSAPLPDGHVTLSLEEFQRLQSRVAEGTAKSKSPVRYFISDVTVQLAIRDAGGDQAVADVTYVGRITVTDKEWTAVDLLPHGTQVVTASIDQEKIDLIGVESGLAWISQSQGEHTFSISIQAPVVSQSGGYHAIIPAIGDEAYAMTAMLPGSSFAATVIPAHGVKVVSEGANTKISATVPRGSKGFQLAWSTPVKERYALNSAYYKGVQLSDKSISISAEIKAELFDDKPQEVTLFPTSVTLEGFTVDGETAPVLLGKRSFGVQIRGKGKHTIRAAFNLPILHSDSPSVVLRIPLVPVTKVELELDGQKDVILKSDAWVDQSYVSGKTVASFHVPLTSEITVSWTEAVPDEVSEELRANAEIYHTALADEGLVSFKAIADFKITRGETNLVEFEVPESAEINRVWTLQPGQIADWRIQDDSGRVLQIFLNQKISQDSRFFVEYDQSLSGELEQQKLAVPLLRARGVSRQKGMVVLLSSKDLTLKPLDDKAMSRVGENQIPADVKNVITSPVSHTFKYLQFAPELFVQVARPERKQGRIDAMVQTLVSLGDVSLKGQTTVIVNVKLGSIEDLDISIPEEVNVLSLTAPSLRTYDVQGDSARKVIRLAFTREMEGQFLVNLSYEVILGEDIKELTVPNLRVDQAEVEQGRIAVEALSNVEVQPAQAKELSSLDPKELPQQLVLKTTNPILMAYKYAKSENPYQLGLTVTRHNEVEVQSARIDSADYRTLVTDDGVAVTFVHYQVRNTRKQFLKVNLPEGAKIWSVRVNNNLEKPAMAKSEDGNANQILVKVRNSQEGFPITLLYQHKVDPLEGSGVFENALPQTDFVISRTQWQVYLPQSLTLGEPDSNMRQVGSTWLQNSYSIFSNVHTAVKQEVEQLPIVFPSGGVTSLTFEKLYASQSDEVAYMRVRYVSEDGGRIGRILSILGGLLVVVSIGVVLFTSYEQKLATAIVGTVGVLIAYTILSQRHRWSKQNKPSDTRCDHDVDQALGDSDNEEGREPDEKSGWGKGE